MVNQQVQDVEVKVRKPMAGQSWALNLSPAKMAVLMSLAIFVVELFIMLVLDRLPSFPPLIEAVIDASLLIAFLVPAYMAFYRPFWQVRQQAQEDIRQLNNRLTAASEDERRRIALDLHDHCDQTLVALQKTIELVQSKIIDTNEEAAALCQEVDELLGRLNNDVRSVTTALHPPQLEAHGLAAALRQHVSQMQLKNINIIIDFIERGEVRSIEKKSAISIYRIAQEAIRNAMLHSGGNLIRVFLEFSPVSVSLSVVDNGIGFNPKKSSQPGHLGLIGMRERTRAHDGSFSVHSEKEKGTSLRVTFKT